MKKMILTFTSLAAASFACLNVSAQVMNSQQFESFFGEEKEKKSETFEQNGQVYTFPKNLVATAIPEQGPDKHDQFLKPQYHRAPTAREFKRGKAYETEGFNIYRSKELAGARLEGHKNFSVAFREVPVGSDGEKLYKPALLTGNLIVEVVRSDVPLDTDLTVLNHYRGTRTYVLKMGDEPDVNEVLDKLKSNKNVSRVTVEMVEYLKRPM